jgi:sigma-E factor negative regulatory protein RseA
MKQEISSLMDGELDAPEAERAIRACCASEEHKDVWNEYHLIGEVLRGHTPRALARDGRMMEAIHREPTVLAPKRRVFESVLGKVSLAAAASVATLGVVSWIRTQGGAPGTAAPVVAKSGVTAVGAIKPVSATTSVAAPQPLPDVQEYLTAHRQIPSAAAYRAVSNRGAAAAR